MRHHIQLDDTDMKILKLLQENARMPVSRISRQVAMSQPSVKERIIKLEESGVITGYYTSLDPARLDRGVSAFLLFKTEKCQAFLTYCETAPEVCELHRTSGDFNYMLKVQTSSIEALTAFQESLLPFGSSKSLVSLKTPIAHRLLL
ncbi:Lrp/AsnC family transcriptional regulator [Paenibacillus sp. J5C_2022]|uniref:Lrp/AsnC family transcriptional regulator n=1 Tax=Paenibacillus sp. J5C2022 TaxID=2977129 RepID=UPI0021CE5109|nr:Lrp/AsnC family transcriptional regulator [Paenibacillus sp. J5C2022]MCU6709166.1 Lrp/AsnC family transcriptional regulator [Paenibacillus sp. J5C2022]